MATGKKEEILVALRTIYPVPQDFITEVENINDTFVDALHKTWMARTEAQWKEKRPEDGADIYNALHPNQGTLQHAMRVCLTNFTQGQRRR
jgi:hypothetical protein